MRSFFLLCCGVLFLLFPARSFSEEIYRVDERVSVGFNVRRTNENIHIIWLYPPEFSAQVDAFDSDAERSEFLRSEMQKTATSGHRASEDKLGYLYLYGIGVAEDFVEAERRFRIGLSEIDRPIGAVRLAERIAYGEDPDRDMATAADLALAALNAGYKKAAGVAVHIGHFYSKNSEYRNLDLAGQLFESVVDAEPENEYALYMKAYVHLNKGEFEEAWDWATKVTELENISNRPNLVRARSIRLQVARELGWEQKLDSEDIIEPLKFIYQNYVPEVVSTAGLIFLMLLLWIPILLMAIFTRKLSITGPRIGLTVLWLVFAGIIGSAVLIDSPWLKVGVFLVAVLMLLYSLNPALRNAYLPGLRRTSFGRWWKPVAEIVVAYLVFAVFMGAYTAVYEMVAGGRPEEQMVAVLLNVDGIASRISTFICVVIFIPIIEEVIFRGFLIDILRKKLAAIYAILVSAMIFGIFHGLTAFVPITCLGIIMGYMRYRNNGLWTPIAFHGLNNALSLTVIWLGLAG